MSEHIITREMLIATLADVMQERDAARKQACSCREGPIQTRNPSAYAGYVELQKKLLAMTEERDALKRENALLTVKLHPPFQSHVLNLTRSVEDEIGQLHEKIRKLEQSQCQCVPVLEKKIAKLEAELRAAYGGDAAPYIAAKDKLSKLRTLFEEGMYSMEVLMSNPPKNIIAYRGLQILREGE